MAGTLGSGRGGKAVASIVFTLLASQAACSQTVWSATTPSNGQLSCGRDKVPVAQGRASDGKFAWECGPPPCARGQALDYKEDGGRKDIGMASVATVQPVCVAPFYPQGTTVEAREQAAVASPEPAGHIGPEGWPQSPHDSDPNGPGSDRWARCETMCERDCASRCNGGWTKTCMDRCEEQVRSCKVRNGCATR